MDHQNQPEHQMVRIKTFPTGAEEWHCTDCTRRFVMQWSPYKKVVLEAGDEYTIHVGSKGGMRLKQDDTHNGSGLSDELLDALNDWLDDVDFDD